MSTTMKKIFLCLIGILAGLAAWPFAEIILVFQSSFVSYLLFSIILGMIFGLVMGAFFCTTEGVVLSDMSKLFSGILVGAIVGVIGGIIGFLVGQGALFIIGDKIIHSMKKVRLIGYPISRAIGWSFLGIFIGMTEGVRAGSLKKIIIGIIGGFFGGAFGGLALEYSRLLIPSIIIARLIGLLIFGFFIGLFYGFVEKSLSFGVLRLLNGEFKGKEFLINQRKVKIGASGWNDIKLKEYEDVESRHAVVYAKKDDLFIKGLDNKNPVKVNDDIIREHKLKMEDVIKIGSAKFLYKFK